MQRQRWPLPRRGPPSVQTSLRPHRRLQLQSPLVPTRRRRAVSAAVVAPPPRRRTRTGHCSCSRCSGRRRPSRATNRAETQSVLLSRRMSQACACRLLRFAWLCADAQGRGRAKGCAVPVGPPAAAPISASAAEQVRPLRCLCSAHPGRACTCTPPDRVAHASSIESIAASTRLLSAVLRCRGVR